MFAPFFTLDGWIALLTLTVLEIVLGIDNIIFLAIVANRVGPQQRKLARRIGLLLALAMRIGLLASLSWIISLEHPVLTVWGIGLSWKDFIFLGGGAFLLTKSTREIHEMSEEYEEHHHAPSSTLAAAVVQIALFDIVFSIDSIVTAVGVAEHLVVMIGAVVVSMMVMLVASAPVGDFVERHPTVKMLVFSFLLMIGMMLVADGFGVHVPRGYIYAAIGFSAGVEALNQIASRRHRMQRSAAQSGDGMPGHLG